MKITNQILSIPPYLSTPWKNVISFYTQEESQGQVLVVELAGGDKVNIPDLQKEEITALFLAHEKFLEQSFQEPSKPFTASSSFPPLPPFLLPNIDGFNAFTALMHHDPEKFSHPDLPVEITEKLAQMLHPIMEEDPSLLPPSEPDCNCPHCQIMNQVSQTALIDQAEEEEEVLEEDLAFRSWDIEEKAHHLYTVTNPLDEKEIYQVFLGNPIGCTCGDSNCDHIKNVLKS